MGRDTKITLDTYAITLIRLKSRQLVGRYGFTSSDREDIEQTLTLALLMRLNRFDRRKGRPATFVRMVVDRQVASLLRERRSISRDYRRTKHSLDDLGDETGDGNLAEPAIDARRSRDLEIDVDDALNTLSGELRSIAEDVRDGTLADAARRHHCSREVIRGRARQIRRHLAGHGLDEYVRSSQFGGNAGVARYDRRVLAHGAPRPADPAGTLPDGARLEIEVKGPQGQQTVEQRAVRRMIGRFGGVYVLARSVQDVSAVLGSRLHGQG